ncbi:MAG: hypothetical protein GY696_25145 [Gammaproteobacteria bacterium]|nr:hypothetical protein [Gammaproteobacteria bacterium]
MMRDRTGAELVEELRQSIRKSIIDIVKTVEGNAAAQAARDAVAEVEAT